MTTSLPDAPEEYANIYEAIGYFVFDFQVLLSTICFQILRLSKHSKQCEKILMQEFDTRKNHSNPLNYTDSLAVNDVNGHMPAAIMVQLWEAGKIINVFYSQLKALRLVRSDKFFAIFSEKLLNLNSIRNDLMHGILLPDESDPKKWWVYRPSFNKKTGAVVQKDVNHEIEQLTKSLRRMQVLVCTVTLKATLGQKLDSEFIWSDSEQTFKMHMSREEERTLKDNWIVG